MIGAFIEPQEQPQEFNKSKHSKILHRKQIQKRLQGLKPSEYEKIITNLKSQNEKLKQEVTNINEKVEDLMQAKKVTKTKNPQIEQQILRLKKQLDLKYESMNYLKDEIKKQTQGDMSQEMKLKIREKTNEAMQYDKEYKQLWIQKQRLEEQTRKNQEDINQFIVTTDPDGRTQSLKRENRQLKHKIQSLKTQLNIQEKQSQEAIDKLYHLKDSEKRGLSKSSRAISNSLKQIKRTSLNEINSLEQQIQSLKSRKKQVEKDIVTQRIIKETKKNRLQKEVKRLIQFNKQLYTRKVKVNNQFNYYEQRQAQLRLQLEKEAQIHNITFQNKQMQTAKVVPLEFRKDWIGKSDGITFDDAEHLQFRGESTIKAVTVYKTAENIVWTKFHYELPDKKKYQSEPPFQRFLLKKFQSKKYESKSSAPLINLIVSAHAPSKKIVRIQFKWADGESSVIGWDIEGSTRYPFGISNNERPVCMFGAVHSIGKFSFVLQTLGCQINTFND